MDENKNISNETDKFISVYAEDAKDEPFEIKDPDEPAKAGFASHDTGRSSSEEQPYKEDFADAKRAAGYLRKSACGGFFARFAAYIIDLAAAVSITKLLCMAFGMSLSKAQYDGMNLAVLVIYSFLSTYITNGFTIGKAIFGLRIKEKGFEKIRPITAFIREFFGKILLFKYPIFGIAALFSDRRLALHDMLSDTFVVKERISFASDVFEEMLKIRQETTKL